MSRWFGTEVTSLCLTWYQSLGFSSLVFLLPTLCLAGGLYVVGFMVCVMIKQREWHLLYK